MSSVTKLIADLKELSAKAEIQSKEEPEKSDLHWGRHCAYMDAIQMVELEFLKLIVKVETAEKEIDEREICQNS